ncbi:hypothetical protein [Candidatus Scalindua japonica]|nr:hypothetical protein [Candidatus Scalindua japonica]
MAVSGRKRIAPHQELWRDVIEATGQPLLFQEYRSTRHHNTEQEARN